MRKRGIAALMAIAFAAGCGNLPVTGDGVVALEVTSPGSLTLQQGASVQLTARALDADGNVVPEAEITWSTPDTTVTVDATGRVTGTAASGTGRVQAAAGTLRSNLVTFTLQPASGS